MLSIETSIRLIIIGQEILIAAMFLFSSIGRVARYSGALLMLSVVGYLVSSDEVLRNSLPTVGPLALFFSLIVPYCLWLFARTLFEAAWPKRWLVVVCSVVVLVDWYTFRTGTADATLWTTGLSVAMHVLSLAIVGHAVWIALSGRPDDLIERRRALRLIFVVVVSLQVASVLVLELVFASGTAPSWLELTNVIAIAIITIGLALPLTDINTDWFAAVADDAVTETADSHGVQDIANDIDVKKLLDLMADGYYRETGLTIRVLAERLDLPEHRLRRLINGQMGYRNFSAFLNSYRIKEAKVRLSDPTLARTPVLTTALSLGYASLGPFNRAFKADTSVTPTDYRRHHMRPINADSKQS